MCDFPSWKEEADGTALFLVDKDLKAFDVGDNDAIGHHAIARIYPGAKGVDREGWPCHPAVAKAIRAGQMREMMEIGGYTAVHVRANGKLHRDDGPAIEWANGAKEWYRDGKLHRDDGPAHEWADGTKEWYRDGKHHRDDGPAIEWANGAKAWYRDGKLHRDDGPALEWATGTKEWYRDGKLLRSKVA